MITSFDQWLFCNGIDRPSKEAKELAGKAWDAALLSGDKEDTLWQRQQRLKITNRAWIEIGAIYQSKRALLKKQVTHWIGKFNILRIENQTLCRKIKAVLKRNAELQKYVTDQETLKIVKTLAKETFKTPLLKSKDTVHEREPAKC